MPFRLGTKIQVSSVYDRGTRVDLPEPLTLEPGWWDISSEDGVPVISRMHPDAAEVWERSTRIKDATIYYPPYDD